MVAAAGKHPSCTPLFLLLSALLLFICPLLVSSSRPTGIAGAILQRFFHVDTHGYDMHHEGLHLRAKVRISRPKLVHDTSMIVKESMEGAGSTLPDCSHACDSCTPCKRVTVSYNCQRHLIIPLSQPCPLAYRCMCNGRSYPVP